MPGGASTQLQWRCNLSEQSLYCMSEQSVSTSVLQLAAGAATLIMTSTFMPSRSSTGRVVLVSSWNGFETGGASGE
jgi:hypothetical protein